MQIWITFILINIIHQTHVSAAPVDATFGKIADAIINPAWTFNNPDSPKKEKKDTDLNKENDENLPITPDGEIDDPNTKNKSKNNSHKKNKRNGKNRNNNKKRKRKRNSGRRNNTRRNGRYLWYSVFTVDDLLVNLPEYRNHEDEQKIVLIWDDKRRIVQNEHVDASSMNNLNNNQLIRQKRDYNNILELQDNILQTRNINQHDLEKNENSMSNSNENTNENMKFSNLRNSNTNKFKNILQNRKQPTNTIRNKTSRSNLAQGLGVTLGADNSEKEESQLKIIEENPQKINAITTLLNDKPELIIRDNTGIDKNTPEIEKIDTIINGINSNSDEGADDDQDSESYPSSIETKIKIPNYSDIEDNKHHYIIKNIKHQFKPKSRKLEKKQLENNDKGTLQTRFTPNAPSINQQKTPPLDMSEHKTEGNTDIAKNIPVNDDINTLINKMNSNSEEDSSSDNSDSNTSSLEKQQDILDFSDLGDNTRKNLLKSIKQPLKPISKIQEETLLENNEKLPEIYEKYLNNPSEINTKNEKGTQQKGNAPTSQSINNQQTPSINIKGHITPEHTDVTKNIPVNDEIETLMNAINSNSEEGHDNRNSRSNPSSLETKQEIPNYSDVEDNKQHDILKNIKHPFKPKSRKLEKKPPKNNDKGTLKTRFTPNTQSTNHQKTPSIDIPEHKTEGNTDIAKNIPVNDEIETLMNAINSNSEESQDNQNSESNHSSLEKQQEIPNYSDIEDNQKHEILKNIKHPFKPKSRKLEKKQLENNDKGTLQTRFTPNAPSINQQKTPPLDISEHKTEGNTDIAKNIPVNDDINTLINKMNSNSEEDSSSDKSDSNTSSLEKQQDILDFSDLGDNTRKNLLKSIKQPLKPISKIQEETLLENNEKLPEIYEKYLNNPSEINTKNEKGTQQKGNAPTSQSINNQQTPSINIKGHITPEHTDVTKNIPVNDEIETLMNAINSNSEESQDNQNSESNHSSLEKQQEIPNYSDIEDNQKHEILKNIKHPFKPKSRKLEKKQLENNDKGTLQTRFTPNTQSTNQQKPPSIDVPGHKTEENTDIAKSISENDEIDTLMNTMNSNLEQDSIGQNLDSNLSSLEKQQDALDFSDLEDNKGKNLLKSIKQPLKPISSMQGKILLVNNEELPGIYKQKKDNPLAVNKNNEEDPQKKTLTKIIQTLDQDKIKPTPANENFNPHIIKKKKLIKTPDFVDTIDPETTDEIEEISIEIPLNDFDISDTLEDLNHRGMKMKSAAVGKLKDKSTFKVLNNKKIKNHKDSIRKTNQNPNKNIHKTSSSKKTVKTPKALSGRQRKKKLDDTSDSNSYGELFSESVDFEEEDLSQPGLKKSKNIPMPITNDIIKNVENDTLNPIPTNIDDKPNTIQKNKLIKTPDLIDTTVPKSTKNENKFLTESPLNDVIDVSDPLGEYKNLEGFTVEDTALEKIKDESPSTILDSFGMKDHDDSLQVTNHPMETNPKTVKPNTKYKSIVDTNIEEIPKKLSDSEENRKLVDKFGSNSYGESVDFEEEDLSQPGLKKSKNIPMPITNDIIKNVENDKLNPIPTNIDDKPNTIQKNKLIKTPDLINTTVPKSTINENKFSTKSPLYDVIDVSDALGEYKNLEGFTVEDTALEKIKDESPSTILDSFGMKDHDVSLQVTNHPMETNPKTVKPNTKYKSIVDKNIDEIPKKLFDSEENRKLVDKFGSNSYGESVDFDEEDLFLPELKKSKNIPMPITNDIIKNVENDTLNPIPTNIDDKPNTIQKNKLKKTPDLIDTIVPKSTKNENKFLTESPLNDVIDVSDPLGEYKNLGGFTVEDTALEKIKDESPSTILDSFGMKNHDDSLQVTNHPMETNPKTVKPNTKYKSIVDTNIEEIPKKLFDSEVQRKLVDKFGSNSYGESVDFEEEDLFLPELKKSKNIIMPITNDMIKNVENDTLNPIPTNIDDKPNTIQKNKLIKTPDLIDTIVPKSTKNENKFLTESPLNDVIDVSDPLGEYKNLGGFTVEDTALEKIKDESPSTILDSFGMKDHDDSLQVTNHPMKTNPKTVKPNTKYKSIVDTNIEEIPKKLFDSEVQRKLVDKFGSNSYDESVDFEEDLFRPELKKSKNIPMPITNDIIKNVENDTLNPIPTNIDDKPNTIQKNKLIKTPDLIDTTVPKSTKNENKFLTESPLNDVIDVSDPFGEYKNLGGFTVEDTALEQIKDESPSTILDSFGMKDHDDNLQVTNHPMETNPKTVKPNTKYKSIVDTNIEEIPKKLFNSEVQRKLVDKFGSNSYGESVDFEEEDLFLPELKKSKNIPMPITNDIIKNVENDTLNPIPTNIDDKPNTIQKNKLIKTPDLIDTTVPKSTKNENKFLTESPLNDVIDVSDPLGEYKNLGGFTIEDTALEKIKDEFPSTILDSFGIKDHDDSLQVTNQPMETNPKTVKPNTKYKSIVDKNIDEIPKNLFDSEGKRKLDDKFGSNSYDESVDFEEDLFRPELKKSKNIPMPITNDIIKNVENDTLNPIPTNIDDKPNTIQKNKLIKTPDLIDTTVPKSTINENKFLTESPLNDVIDVSDPLGEYKNLGGFTVEVTALEKIKDESPSTILDSFGMKDHDDSLQVTNHPMETNPKTVKPNTKYKSIVDTNIDEIPKNLFDSEGKRKLDDKFGSNSYDESVDFEEDLFRPEWKKSKNIPMPITNDIIKNVENDTLNPIPTNIDDKPNTIQKNKLIKTPDLIDTTVPKSTKNENKFLTESPLNDVIDVSDPLGEYKNLGGFTIEDTALEKIKDEFPSTILDSFGIKDHDDSLQVTNQPMETNPKTVKPNTKYKSIVDKNIDEIPKNLFDSEGKRKLDDKFGSNSYDESVDFEEDLFRPELKKSKNIPMPITNDIIKNVENDTLNPIPTNIDDKPNTIQKNKLIKTPDLIDTTVPKSTINENKFLTESPLNDVIDVSDPLGEYKNLGGFTVEDTALEKIKDESPSTILDSFGMKDHDDSLQVTNHPMETNPKTVKPNTKYKSIVDTNIDEILKNLFDSEGKRKLDDKFGSNSYDESVDFEEDLFRPEWKKSKNIPMPITNDIIKNVENDTLNPIPTNIDDKPNTIQKNKLIKTPDLIDTIVPKSTKNENKFLTESPLNDVIDVSDPLGEYKNLGGFTVEDTALEKIKDESPSTILDSFGMKDHDDSLQVTNHPMKTNPKTVKPNTKYKSIVDTNIEEIPKKLFDSEVQRKLVDKFGSNSYDESVDFEEDLFRPELKKSKNIPMPITNDIIKNVENDTLNPIPTNIDDKPNTIQKNKLIKTPDLIDTTVPKSTKNENKFLTESPLNDVIDVSDPFGEYKNLGGFTVEDTALEQIKDESPSTILDSFGMKDHDDNLQVTNHPMETNPKTVKPNTKYKSIVDTNIEEIPKKLFNSEVQRKLVDKFGSNSYGESVDFEEEDLFLPELKKSKNIPMPITNDIIKNVENDTLNPIPTNIDDKPNTIQKNKLIKTPDLIDTTVPKSTKNENKFLTESPLNDVIDVSDPLGEYKNLGGFTIEDTALEKIKDEFPSTILDSFGIKDHDDSLQVTNQPMETNPKTVKPNTKYKSIVDKNIDEIPKNLFDSEGKRKLDDKFGSNSYDESVDFEEDLFRPELKKSKNIPMPITNDIIKNVENDTLNPIPTNIDDKPNTIQKNKLIKTPDLIDTTVPKSTINENKFLTESPLNDVIDVSDPLGEYKNLGGFTVEVTALEKIKDESPSTILDSFGMKDHDDSLQVTNHPMETNPKTVKPNTKYKSIVDTNIDEIPKNLFDSEGKRKLDDKFGSNSYDESVDFEEDLFRPEWKKSKNIPMPITNDIIKNVENDTLNPIPTNIDDKPNTIQKNKLIKTPDLIDTTVPKSTKNENKFLTESPLNDVIDVSDPLGEYKNLGGFTIEDTALEKIKDEFPSTILDSFGIKDHDDSLQVTNQPMETNPKTVKPNTKYKSIVDKNIDEIPKNLFDSEGKRKLDDKFGSNSYDESVDFEEDLFRPELKKSKNIPMPITNDIIKNVENDTLNPIPTNIDDKPNTIQKNKLIKTPDLIDTTVPKSTINENKFLTESPLNDVIDVSDPLGEYKNLGGFTVEDTALEKIKDESPSTILDSFGMKDHDDSLQVTNHPMETNPKTVKPNTKYKSIVDTNIDEILKNLFDSEGKRKLDDKFGSNSYDESVDFEEDLFRPEWKKSKNIPMPITNDIIKNVENDTLNPIPTNIDDKPNTIQKNKLIKTPDLINTTVPKSTINENKFLTESPLNDVIDVSDPLGEYKNLGGFTVEDTALEKIKDESPSTILDSFGMKDHDDSLQVTNHPMKTNPKTVKPNTKYKSIVDTNIEEIPKKLPDSEVKRKLVDKFGSNSYDESVDFEEDLFRPELKKSKNIPMPITNDIIKNVENDTLNPIPTNIDDKPNTIQKNKLIKTPDLIDTTVPKSTINENKFLTESPLNDVIDVSDPLGEYKNLGGFTVEDTALEKIKDESPSTILDSIGMKDHDDSLQVTNHPMETNPKTVKPNTKYKSIVDTNIEEIPKKLSDSEVKRKLVDKFGSNSYDESVDFEEDLFRPELKKSKNIPMPITNDIIKNVENDTLNPIPTNIDDKPNTIQKNKLIKIPDLIDTTVPKSTKNENKFLTESPLNDVIDVSDPLGEYKNLGGFTIEDTALEKIKDEFPSTILDSFGIKDHDDSLQVTNHPMKTNPKTVKPNTKYKSIVDTNIEEIPKKLPDSEVKRKLVDKFGSNSYDESVDFEDLFRPELKKSKNIPMPITNDIIKNVENDTLNPIPTNIDDKPNTIQKNKLIKTPDLINTTVPKSTINENKFLTESPLNDVIDVSDPLGEYKNLGGFTVEDTALEKIKDESPSTILDSIGMKDHDDSLQVTNHPMETNPKTVKPNTKYKSIVDTNIEEIPKKLSDSEVKRKLVDKFGSNSYDESVDFEEDLFRPELKKSKNIPMPITNDIIKNVENDTLNPIPTNIDDKPNTIQKNKLIKIPDLIDTTVPKSTKNKNKFLTESPLNDVIDVSDPLGEYKNLGGFTIEDTALEKIKDEFPSTILDSFGIKDHDDSLQVTNHPMKTNPKTVKPNTKYKSIVDTNIEEIPKKLPDSEVKRKLVDKFGSNSYDESVDFEDLFRPELKKSKNIPMPITNDIIKNVENDTLNPIPTNIDDKPNTIQKNKLIKTPDLINTTVPKSTINENKFLTESPLNDVIDVSDPLGEYKNLGGFTVEDTALEKIKDESPSTILDSFGMKDHDDSLQVTNHPMETNPKTVKPNTKYKSIVDTNIEEIPKKLSDSEVKRKLVDKFGSNSYDESVDFEEDLFRPELKKSKNIPMPITNDIIKNVENDTLNPIPTNIDDKSNTIQKNKLIKTPDLIDTTVPKSTMNENKFLTESPLNDVIDVSDPLGEYKNLGGFTVEDTALEKIKDESPSTILDSFGMKDHDDSLQVTNHPMETNPKTVKPNTKYKSIVDTNIEEIPKKLSDSEVKRKLVDKFGSNSYDESVDFEEDLFRPELKKSKNIPMPITNDIIKNVENDTLNPIPTNIDDKPNTIQKNKLIKTPDLIDTTVPKSTKNENKFLTESPLNDVIDVSDPLGEYKNLGGFTIEDTALEKIKDEFPSTILDSFGIKDHDDSLQATNQPMETNPKTVKPNTKYKSIVDTNIEEIPKKLFDSEGKRKLVDKFGSNSYGESVDFEEEDLSQPGLKKSKNIPMPITNDIIKNVEDDTLKPISTNIDDKPNTKQKYKLIKTPDLIDTSVSNTNYRVNEFSPEIPFTDIDVSDSLECLNNLKVITMEDAAMERKEDESPSSALNNYKKKNRCDSRQKIYEPKLIYPVTEESTTEYNVRKVKNIKTYTPSTTTNIDEIPNILPNLDNITLKSTLTDGDNIPYSLQKNKLIKKLNSVSNTDSKLLDLMEPTSQTNYDIIMMDNNLPLSKIPSNVIDKHSSNSKTMYNNINNSLNNDKDVTFNRSFITNHFVEYNSKDLSSLEDGNIYGYMSPKFRKKYNEGDESNYNIWETIPPKKSNDVSLDKGYDNLINDFNQSSGYTTKNNNISTHTFNENNIVTGTESVKNNYNNDKVNTDIHNNHCDDFIKKMSEQLFKKIDNIDDKLARLDKVSHNCSYVREIGNIRTHEPTMNNVLLTNDIPNTKPEKVINIEDSYSKTNKPIESLEINISNKSDNEIEINKNESPKAKKHKNKKHKRHGRDSKKKGEENNKSTNDNGDDGDDDDDYDDDDNDNDDDNHKNDKRHKHKDKHNDDKGKHKKNKRYKNKDINNDDDGKHKKNKRHKNKDLNDNDNGKHKKNKRHKKNKKIDDDNDNGGHRKKSHKKKYSKVDNDVVSKHKKHRSHKKKDRNYNNVEILRSKKTDNKKKKKLKENVYSHEESNDVNYSSSIQINSENNDSAERLKTTSSKSKMSKKSNSTKSKKCSPKKKSKYVKHSKTIKYKNKEIPVDISDEDTSSNENNYNSEKTYIKYISNNNQNNVPKDKKHKHKKHNKHSKTSKTYIYKKIPEDKDSDENSVNLEETYNINIISDDDTLRQKKHRHKKNKKKKNFDINIVKDTDTDTQVLNNDKETQNGFQFYRFYPQYRYATLNPFARILTNSYF